MDNPPGEVTPADAAAKRSPPLGQHDARQIWKRWTPRESTTSSARPYARPPGSAGGRRARQDFVCEHCGRVFLAKPVHDHRGVSPRRFCSKRCTGAHRTAYAHAEQAGKGVKPAKPARENGVVETAAELINMSLVQPLTPAQSAKVRGYVFGLLRAQFRVPTASSWASWS